MPISLLEVDELRPTDDDDDDDDNFLLGSDSLLLFCFDKEIGFLVDGGGFNELLVLLGSRFDLCAEAG